MKCLSLLVKWATALSSFSGSLTKQACRFTIVSKSSLLQQPALKCATQTDLKSSGQTSGNIFYRQISRPLTIIPSFLHKTICLISPIRWYLHKNLPFKIYVFLSNITILRHTNKPWHIKNTSNLQLCLDNNNNKKHNTNNNNKQQYNGTELNNMKHSHINPVHLKTIVYLIQLTTFVTKMYFWVWMLQKEGFLNSFLL